jgi:hypothetical protein
MARLRSVLVLLALSAAGAASSKDLPRGHSWGRPDVTFLQYRTDAVECAEEAANAPQKPAGTNLVVPPAAPPPQANVGGRTAEDSLADLVDAYNVNKLIAKAKVIDVLQSGIDACLTARGYRPFVLTKAQADELRGIRPGTKARQLYLYRLAVDPEVLKNQVAAR